MLKKKCVKGSIAKRVSVAEAEWLKRHKTYSRLDRIICPSEFMRNKFIEAGLPERQLVLMRNFLNPDSMSREVANQIMKIPTCCIWDAFLARRRVNARACF